MGDPLPQGVVNAAAGFGDGISFGGTDWIRGQMGTNGSVDKCSLTYSSSSMLVMLGNCHGVVCWT